MGEKVTVGQGFASSWEVQPCADTGGVTVHLKGKLTYPDLPMFRAFAESLLGETTPAIDLCMEELTFLDSTALGTLIWFRQQVSDRGGALRLTNPNWKIQRILKVTRFDQLFIVV